MAFQTRTHHHHHQLLLLVVLFPLFLSSHTISTVSSFNNFARSSSLREHVRASKPIHRSFHGQRNVHYFPAYKSSPSSSPDYDHRRSLQTNTTDISTSKKQPQAIRWLVGVALGMVSGALTVLMFYGASHLIRWGMNQKKLVLKPVIYQRSIDSKSIAFLQDENALQTLDLLGKGGSGEVYKATVTMQTRGGLITSTKTVAIKKVNGISNVVMINNKTKTKTKKIKKIKKQEEMCMHLEEEVEDIDVLTKNSAQIRAEMDTLGHVRHRNLLTLLAYVPRPNSHLLVYDFMVNGSLSDALAKAREGTLELDWSMRYSIALGVAEGLKYLHNDARPRIIHRDLKPGNILLDEAMEAHIGDFGLAKLVRDDSTHVTGSNWVGTVGYVAPEYTHALNFSDKGDVYAFGVVLVVLLTNQQPLSEMFLEDGDNYMGGWVANAISLGSEHILGKFDKRILGHGFEEQMLLTFRIASFCLAKSPSARPSSIDVLAMLNQVAQAHL